ncbi:GNAT family N-acetyltransferase [Serratia rubidaea]|uniref:GNAT family N-acetyltransferase n=1 Tax=Serratia rubidaea TaxID=61652 RepID=UPI00234AAFE0|nr:GNAT family N-acetyltransferase [Serratia rubidaea]MDC6119102.1 GNAT family N-acetyltransferase [Serratia rubidaea]
MQTAVTWHKGPFHISTDPSSLDIDAIHAYLSRSNWAENIDIETVRMAIAHSLNFGLYLDNKQIGFARLTTDFATFGYLCDVYILEEHQHQGLGSWLIECCQSHPIMQRLRRIMLVTSSAPWLYKKFGYEPVNRPDFVWQIAKKDIYKQAADA